MILFSFSQLHGQNIFLSGSTESFSNLTTSEDSILTKIQASGTYSDLYLISLNSLAQSQVDGRLTINIPDNDCEDLTYYAKTVEYENESDYTWYGTLESTAEEGDNYCREGVFTMVSTEDGKIGHITIDEKAYELLELSENTFIIGRVDDSRFTQWECATGLLDTTSTNFMDDDPPAEQRNINCNTVRCLILYTQNALEAEGSINNINSRARLGIQQTNTILRNSDIRYDELVIELAGIQQINFEETDIRSDITTIYKDPEAINLREQYEADIVVLLTDGNYFPTLGIAWLGPDIKEIPYAIVESTSATARYTFSHEIGHLFGADHEVGRSHFLIGFAHGYSFTTKHWLGIVKKRRLTIVHTLQNDATRVMHFSNPDVKYKRKKTGVEDANDNARQIRNTACTVAQFMQPTLPFFIRIEGDEFMCPCQSVYLETVIMNGAAGVTYQYQWYSSNDGINWSSLYNTTPYLSIQVPCTEGKRLFVKVEVSSSDGSNASSIKAIEAANEWPRQEAPCALFMVDSGNNKTDLNAVLSISPNPSTSQSEISYSINDSGIHSIFVYDMNGQRLKTILNKEYLQEGNYQYYLNLEAHGVYFIQSVDDQGNHNTVKFIKF